MTEPQDGQVIFPGNALSFFPGFRTVAEPPFFGRGKSLKPGWIDLLVVVCIGRTFTYSLFADFEGSA